MVTLRFDGLSSHPFVASSTKLPSRLGERIPAPSHLLPLTEFCLIVTQPTWRLLASTRKGRRQLHDVKVRPLAVATANPRAVDNGIEEPTMR
jgi:hypothetical protein